MYTEFILVFILFLYDLVTYFRDTLFFQVGYAFVNIKFVVLLITSKPDLS